MRKRFVCLCFLILAVSFFSMSVCFAAEQIQLRPAETTLLIFDSQIKDARLQTGINADLQLENFPNRGIVVITTLETFSSGNFHLIFENGDVRTFTATVDTTAPLRQEFTSSTTTHHNSVSATPAVHVASDIPSTSLASAPPTEVKSILNFIQHLERYTPTRLHYAGTLPYGLRGMITRVNETSSKYVYEVEVENILNRSITLHASDFEHGLTEAIYIVNMSPAGSVVLGPSESTFVYISERL